MRIDRQRAVIDLVTLLVPVVFFAALTTWQLLVQPEWSLPATELVAANGQLALMAVIPQLAQAVVGQLLIRRLGVPAWVRGTVMVAVWHTTLALMIVAATGGVPTLWALYIPLLVTPLQVVTRLVVHLVVVGRSRRARQPATAP